MTTVRLLSYNIRSLRDDADAVARVIRDARPDVVCIQEAPRFLRWRQECAAIARATDLLVVTGGRPAAANLLLCTLAVRVERAADLLLTPVRGLYRRGAAVGVFRLRGARFAVAGTHLDLEGPARLAHARELLGRLDAARLGGADLPLVVAGDINETPGAPAWSLLAARLPDVAESAGSAAPTSPARDPVQRIDGIFADPRVSVRRCTVPDSPDVAVASDHRPVLAELDVPDL